MRRVIVFLTCLLLTLVTGVGTASAAPPRRGPLPATLRAEALAQAGTPGALIPVQGILLDAQRRPITGQPVVATITGAPDTTGLVSLTGSGGSFELYVPLPDEAPAAGTVEVRVSFNGTTEAAASAVVLPVKVEPVGAPADAEAGRPADAPAPAATAPTAHGGTSLLPTSGSPMIDQLIVVAAGLLGVMVVLIAIGAGLRRR